MSRASESARTDDGMPKIMNSVSASIVDTNNQNEKKVKLYYVNDNSGDVKEFCDPRIQIIKKTIEEVFDIDIHNHSLYFYGTKKQSNN